MQKVPSSHEPQVLPHPSGPHWRPSHWDTESVGADLAGEALPALPPAAVVPAFLAPTLLLAFSGQADAVHAAGAFWTESAQATAAVGAALFDRAVGRCGTTGTRQADTALSARIAVVHHGPVQEVGGDVAPETGVSGLDLAREHALPIDEAVEGVELGQA